MTFTRGKSLRSLGGCRVMLNGFGRRIWEKDKCQIRRLDSHARIHLNVNFDLERQQRATRRRWMSFTLRCPAPFLQRVLLKDDWTTGQNHCVRERSNAFSSNGMQGRRSLEGQGLQRGVSTQNESLFLWTRRSLARSSHVLLLSGAGRFPAGPGGGQHAAQRPFSHGRQDQRRFGAACCSALTEASQILRSVNCLLWILSHFAGLK